MENISVMFLLFLQFVYSGWNRGKKTNICSQNSGIGYIHCVRMGMLRKPYFPNQQIKISFATILDT